MTTPSKNKNSAPKLTPSFANDEDETTAKRENEALDDKNTMEVDCNELKPPSSSDMETHSRVIKLDRNEPDCVGPFIASRCRRQHFPKSSPVESIGSKMADGKENGMVQGESGSGVPVGASDSGIQKKISEVPTYSNYRPIVANGPGLQCRKSFLQDGQHRPFKNIGPALEEVKNLKVGRFDEWKPPAALNIDGPFDLGQVQYVIGREPDTTNDLILPSMGLSSGPSLSTNYPPDTNSGRINS